MLHHRPSQVQACSTLDGLSVTDPIQPVDGEDFVQLCHEAFCLGWVRNFLPSWGSKDIVAQDTKPGEDEMTKDNFLGPKSPNARHMERRPKDVMPMLSGAGDWPMRWEAVWTPHRSCRTRAVRQRDPASTCLQPLGTRR